MMDITTSIGTYLTSNPLQAVSASCVFIIYAYHLSDFVSLIPENVNKQRGLTTAAAAAVIVVCTAEIILATAMIHAANQAGNMLLSAFLFVVCAVVYLFMLLAMYHAHTKTM